MLVYVYDLGLWLLRESFPPCYKKLENDNFTKIFDATTKEVEFQMAFFNLNVQFCMFHERKSAWNKMIAEFRWHFIYPFAV